MLCYRCGHYAPDGSAKCPGCGQVFNRAGGGGGEGTKRKTSTQRAPQAIFSIGETVAERYRILDVLGAGGVGAVYRAHDTDIDVDVALKAVAPKLLQTADEQKTFSKFIKTARKLHHANIVRLYDEGRDAGPNGERRFFTMQLLEGLTLRKIIALRREKSQVFTVPEVEPIFVQLAAALDYAHKTVWHGDLKPENVLVLPDLLKVTDFCIIQALPTKPFLAIQKSRGAAYQYIAPEVRLEASRIDGRADVYSMGVMLAEMLTGQVYEGHASKEFQQALGGLGRNAEQLIRRALHESPDARPQSAGELAEALTQLAQRGEAARVVAAESSGRSQPPPPPVDSGVHEVPSHVQKDGSIPELSASSVIMLAELQDANNYKPSPTDITQVPDDMVEEESDADQETHAADGDDRDSDLPPPLSEETPAIGLPRRKVDSAMEVDTDEQRPRGARKPQADQETPADNPAPLGPPVHEDTESDDSLPDDRRGEDPTAPASAAVLAKAAREREESRRNGHPGRNGAARETSSDPLGPPPPLPDDASDSGRLVAAAGEISIHDEPTLAEKGGKVPIYDALTSLRPQSTRPPTHPGIPPIPGSLPPQERPTLALPNSLPPMPPPAPPPQPQERRGIPMLAVFALIGLLVGTGGFFVFRYIRALENKVQQQQQAQQPVPRDPGPPTVPAASGPPVAQPVDPEAEKKRLEEERLAREAEARRKADEEARLAAVQKQAEEEARRKAQQEEEARKREEAAQQSPAEKRKAEREEKKRQDEERRAAEAEEKKRLAEERAEEKRRQEEERKTTLAAAAEARKRQDEEKKAAAAAAADARKKEAEEKKAAAAAAAEEKRKQEEAAKTKTVAQAAGDPSALTCPKGMAMIAQGPFRMGSAGSDPMHNFEEKRLEEVDVGAFCVDYYEYPNSKSAKPTTGVSWFQAQELCKAKGKRLCEENEWEKACKGEAMLRYPYGNDWDPDRCNTQDAEGNDRELAEQKAFPKCRSGYGPINMSGNASEWVASQFSASNKDRVHKGGAANRPDWATRCANRTNLAPSSRNPFVGFRCCADPVAGGGE